MSDGGGLNITGECQRRIDAYDSEAQRHRDAALQAAAKRDAYQELLQWAAERQGANGDSADGGQQRKTQSVCDESPAIDPVGTGDDGERDPDGKPEL